MKEPFRTYLETIMKSLIRNGGICILVVLLSGCTLFRAVTFHSDDKTSFKREGSTVTLETYSRNSPENCKDGRPIRKSTGPYLTLPFLAGIVGAVVAVGMNIAESEIQAYLDKKKKEFTGIYNVSTSLPYYYSRVETADLFNDRANKTSPEDVGKLRREKTPPYSFISFNCLKLTRTIKGKDSNGKDTGIDAFEWVASLIPNDSHTALMIRTDSIKLSRAAAKTDNVSRKIDLTVEVKIDVTTLNDKGEIFTNTVADKILSYTELQTPGDETLPVQPQNSKVVSSWFPAIPRSQREIDRCEQLQKSGVQCEGVSPVSISVLVTEIGSGGDMFGTVGKQIDDNKKTLNDAFNKAVTDALTPK